MGIRRVWRAENPPQNLVPSLDTLKPLCRWKNPLGARCWWSVLTANRGMQEGEGGCPAGIADLGEFRPGIAEHASPILVQVRNHPTVTSRIFYPMP